MNESHNRSVIKAAAPVRLYAHGDVLRGGRRYYDALLDSSEPIRPGPVEAWTTPLDVWKYLRTKRSIEERATRLWTRGTVWRPKGARNLFANHPLVRAHPRHLRALCRRQRRDGGDCRLREQRQTLSRRR